VPGKVARMLGHLGEVERLCSERLGVTLTGRRMLDVGAGQLLLQMAYFTVRGNDVVGIDSDVIARGVDPRAYLRMLRANGPYRVVKTLGRKVLVVDARYKRAFARQMGIATFPRLDVREMDATELALADETFDFVYSLAVFQHLRDPEPALDEMIRVLRPGGGLYLDFMLYTSRTGSGDIRSLAGRTAGAPLWAHLRPHLQEQVRPSAYVNHIRLPQWRRIFETRMAGVEIVLRQPEAEELENEARTLRDRGELRDYTLDELLTSQVAVLWRKPEPDGPRTPASEQGRLPRAH
jgi:SAM-dependent methyltransferase